MLCFSALQRAEIAEMPDISVDKFIRHSVSVLFNEPKLLKWSFRVSNVGRWRCFSALQRAEIAEMRIDAVQNAELESFSALQRAEIAEIAARSRYGWRSRFGFSALQRAEIAEICAGGGAAHTDRRRFSALQRAEIAEILNEPPRRYEVIGFSALQRAEIAEIWGLTSKGNNIGKTFQCSSTSRNC